MKKPKKIHSYLVIAEYHIGSTSYTSRTVIDKSAKCKTKGEALLYWKDTPGNNENITNIIELD